MLPLAHITLSLILAVLLKIFTALDSMQILIILLSAVLIDIDHWLVYVFKKKDLNISKSYGWFISLRRLKKKPVFLYIFHTVELFILIFLLSLKFLFFQFVLIGILFHMIIDLISSIKEREYLKEISLVYLLLKNERKPQ